MPWLANAFESPFPAWTVGAFNVLVSSSYPPWRGRLLTDDEGHRQGGSGGGGCLAAGRRRGELLLTMTAHRGIIVHVFVRFLRTKSK